MTKVVRIDYAQRERDAEAVRQRILAGKPNMVFASSRPKEEGYSRVYMVFEVEGRRYIFYTGVEETQMSLEIHRGAKHNYANPRVLHHAHVSIGRGVMELDFDRTDIEGSTPVGKSLQSIALTAVRDKQVRVLEPKTLKATLESARSLMGRDHTTPLIQ